MAEIACHICIKLHPGGLQRWTHHIPHPHHLEVEKHSNHRRLPNSYCRHQVETDINLDISPHHLTILLDIRLRPLQYLLLDCTNAQQRHGWISVKHLFELQAKSQHCRNQNGCIYEKA